MDHDRFDALTRVVSAAIPRRRLSRWLAGGALGVLLAHSHVEGVVGKKKKRKKKRDCPRGQQKDPYGICGVPPNDCLTVGALCSGTAQPCCSGQCFLVDGGFYRCVPSKARCLIDFGCVPGYVCRGYRCVPG
jgi:hypothetical protein